MADTAHSITLPWKIDRVWVFVLALPFVIAAFDPGQAVATVEFAINAMGQTGVFIVFAVLAIGYLKATGAEVLLARDFEGR